MQALMPAYLWQAESPAKVIYLTFDDGPIPEVTPWVLDTLAQYGAKATFFCVGENVERNPDIFQRLLAEGHAVGNHTYNHWNGWQTDTARYCNNIKKCSGVVKSHLFRPPYGRITATQRRYVQRYYRIVMWDVLSGDFDPEITPEACWVNVRDNAERGSIIVFHDSRKAEERLRYALPRTLEHFAAQGYRFEAIGNDLEQKGLVSWLFQAAS